MNFSLLTRIILFYLLEVVSVFDILKTLLIGEIF
ncbi:hypothetical protein P609_10110 [Comamonas thiooxydans]|nr:hypothetical protein P609_10110 [Comamonas thiooxydans]